MEKKTYMIPVMTVITVDTTDVIAQSPSAIQTFSMGKGDNYADEVDASTYRNSLWSD